jgi:hypothetical protein
VRSDGPHTKAPGPFGILDSGELWAIAPEFGSSRATGKKTTLLRAIRAPRHSRSFILREKNFACYRRIFAKGFPVNSNKKTTYLKHPGDQRAKQLYNRDAYR